MTEFKVKQLIWFPSYWKILRFEKKKLTGISRVKSFFVIYPGGGHHKDIEVFELFNCGITVVH